MNQKGFGLLEVAVVSAIVLAVVLAVLSGFSKYIVISKGDIYETKANYLAEEGMEAVRILRDTSWSSNIPTDVPSTIGVAFDPQTHEWQSTSTFAVDSMFERKITFEDVDVPDPKIRKVSVYVSWKGTNSTSTKKLVTYISNIFSN